jgi:hypothetical protein
MDVAREYQPNSGILTGSCKSQKIHTHLSSPSSPMQNTSWHPTIALVAHGANNTYTLFGSLHRQYKAQQNPATTGCRLSPCPLRQHDVVVVKHRTACTGASIDF